MRGFVFALIALVAFPVVAEEAAKNARELGEQVHVIKKKARAEKASAYRKFKAKKLDARSKAWTASEEAASKAGK
jgi:hypothetical protein